MKPKKVAVILSGCGVFDGSEINEAVLTLLAIDKMNAQSVCFAPNIEQKEVINHLTQEPMRQKRNVLEESARIARGKIQDLRQFQAHEFDALIFPGGFGAAKNLSDFADKGESCQVLPQVAQAVKAMAQANKPVGFICIAPAMIPLLYPQGIQLTIGNDETVAKKLVKMGAEHVQCSVEQTVVDRQHKVVSTPAYMLAQRLSEAAQGIENLVKEILALT